MNFVLRCTRVPAQIGKAVRHGMRHHWGLSHHTARIVYHAPIVATLVCTAIPFVWDVQPAREDQSAPPADVQPAGDAPSAPPVIMQEPGAGMRGEIILEPYPRSFGHTDFAPAPFARADALGAHGMLLDQPQGIVVARDADAHIAHVVAEPSSILTFSTGIALMLLLRRRAHSS